MRIIPCESPPAAIRAAILSAPSATALINVTSDAYTAVLDPLEPDLRRGPRHRR